MVYEDDEAGNDQPEGNEMTTPLVGRLSSVPSREGLGQLSQLRGHLTPLLGSKGASSSSSIAGVFSCRP